ncbi:MAG: hypothetical protein JNN07_23185 [Verrucomicrobiales bacterium]|nr:hypothetical protein [Verrucomicrobiales bacterium]
MVETLTASAEAEHGEHRHAVSITIDGKPFNLRPGQHRVSEIRGIGGVPGDYELEQVMDGRFIPLASDGKVHIKGGEVFVSHPKDAGSS